MEQPAHSICERFHHTIQDEFYAVAFRKKIYSSLEELQIDLEGWMGEYNTQRPHSGKYCFGKTPMQTFLDSKTLAKQKILAELYSADELSAEALSTKMGYDIPPRASPPILVDKIFIDL